MELSAGLHTFLRAFVFKCWHAGIDAIMHADHLTLSHSTACMQKMTRT
jgi:hypothetical protein